MTLTLALTCRDPWSLEGLLHERSHNEVLSCTNCIQIAVEDAEDRHYE
jgi:hypothetical protein